MAAAQELVKTDERRPGGGAREALPSVVVRFAGDSGDGMQLTGLQFTDATAVHGNDLSTFPDFPAEIRAPAGALFGVSAFQINFGSDEITTPGDALDVLVAMNPAALRTNLADLRPGGLLVVDTGAFGAKNLRKAGYDRNPLENGGVSAPEHRRIEVDVTRQVQEAVAGFGLTHKQAVRCKNMWVLGLLMWLYGRDRAPTVDGLSAKFSHLPAIRDANVAALNAGHAFGETAELPGETGPYEVPPRRDTKPGLYRNVNGTEAMAFGLLAASRLSGLPITFASYPITPASNLLHALAARKEFGVTTFQAEDEMAAVCAAIGASWAGGLGVTSSSGPGIALKTEAITYAATVELPLIVINTQRAGPSTGMPTKAEQSDLYQAVFGRAADVPLPVLAAASPAECFDVAVEAARIATRYMTPVIVLSDAYLANASEPWRIPDLSGYEPFPPSLRTDPEGFHPYLRDPDTLARPWARPGTPGLEHRVGGIEKGYDTGHISYDPDNHQRMTDVRTAKIDGIAESLPDQGLEAGEAGAALAVVGWGSTWGAIHQAVRRVRADGLDVAHVHLRHLWPLPRNLGPLLRSFGSVLVPEMNKGQLLRVLRSEYLIDAAGLSKVAGRPFRVGELEAGIRARAGARAEGRS